MRCMGMPNKTLKAFKLISPQPKTSRFPLGSDWILRAQLHNIMLAAGLEIRHNECQYQPLENRDSWVDVHTENLNDSSDYKGLKSL